MYKFKKGDHYKGLEPQTVGTALEGIRQKYDGQLMPDHVVSEAKNKKHPLHDIFTWDDSEAAHEHRKWQARMLIRQVVVVYGDNVAPAFVNVSVTNEDDESERYYQAVNVLTIDEYQSALKYANAKLKEAIRSLEYLKRIAPAKSKKPVQRAIDGVHKAQKAL